MKKYYIEISDIDDPSSYILQSRWYETEKAALKFAKEIDFLDKQYVISLMSSRWDTSVDSETDIVFEKFIRK